MAKGQRASTRKRNNSNLRAKFAPIYDARTERLSAKLQELAAQPKPPRGGSMEVDEDEGSKIIGDDDVDMRRTGKPKTKGTTKQGPTRIQKKIANRKAKKSIVFERSASKKKRLTANMFYERNESSAEYEGYSSSLNGGLLMSGGGRRDSSAVVGMTTPQNRTPNYPVAPKLFLHPLAQACLAASDRALVPLPKKHCHIPRHVFQLSLVKSPTFLMCYMDASRTFSQPPTTADEQTTHCHDKFLAVRSRQTLKMRAFRQTLHGVLLCLYVSHINAFWRMVCGTIQTGRIDPIVNPGGISGHCHTVAGPLNFNTTSTFASYQASYCTSCGIQQDLSAYWTPQMYYRHRNGTYQYAPHDGTVVYYLGRGINNTGIIPFPPGFRMLSGDNGARAYDANTLTYENQQTVANRVSFACLDSSGPMPETPYLGRTNCSSGLRAQIHFQSCWDGINLYKSDQSHVAYLSEIDNGACPPGYPWPLPHLFYEIIYATNTIDQSDGGMFVFSNGDTTGFAFHGDFQNGWNVTVLQNAVTNCLNTNDGSISDCPALAASLDPYFSTNCPEQPPLVNETTKGLLNALPGCNPPTGGPQRAAAAVCPIVPSLNYIPNQDSFTRYIPVPGDLRAGWQYLGCSTDNTTVRPLSGPSYINNTGLTIEQCTAFCHTKQFPLAGMEYGTQCYCGTALPASQPILSPTQCSLYAFYVCSGATLELGCGAPYLMQVWQDTNYIGLPIKPAPTPGVTNTSLSSGVNGTYLSCHAEGTGSRALNGYSFTNTTSMSVELCGLACSKQNYLYFGMEYSSQCYCGNSIGTAVLAESSCSFPCAGYPSEYCGAGSILSVWSLPGAPPSASPGSSPTASTSSVPLSTVVPNSKYLGCYSETAPRALGGAGFSNASVSNTLCAQYAQQLNLPYFYTEYFSQCYVGTTLNPASTPISAASCNAPCTGNSVQTCGGSNALSLFNNTAYQAPGHPSPVTATSNTGATGQYAYQGCYTEGTSGRALGGNAQFQGTTASGFIAPGSMTVEACAEFCFGNGYPYMGVENAQECYCNGAGVINGAVVGTGCTMTCLGTPFEFCGGSSRIDVYKQVGP